MLVKRLEIQGFKSFAERGVLEFGPGVSGIVGANGSGKSNIADAIRWVLGEQNPRQLRCTRMEDLIFNGSGTRRPLGFTEVVLVLDNEQGRLPLDYTEISITRRLYRSGESEYLLNGAPARLRDITELLAGTGLGREGYSIVGQGRIDDILIGSPESRRSLFDEACGIGLHRSRKRDALSRLDDVASRLERVSDVVGELEAQLAPLDRQAAVARSFVAYRDELEGLELWLEAGTVARLRSRMSAAVARLAEAREETESLRERETRLEEEVKTLRTAFSELGELLEQRRRETASSEAARREMAEKARALQTLISDRDRESTLVREEEGRLAERRQRLAVRLEELEAAKAARSGRLADARRELAEAEAECGVLADRLGTLREALEVAKTDLMGVVSRAGAARYELSSAEAELSRLRAEEARLAREAETGREGVSLLSAEVASLAVRLEEVKSEAGRSEAALGELERRQASLEAEALELGAKIEDERSAVAELEIRKSALEAALAAESTWSRSAMAAVAAARNEERTDDRLLGVLGEELEVGPGERVALEVALGRHAGAVVVRTEADLRHYMSYLKSEGVGPAVLVSLDLVNEHLARQPSKTAGAGRLVTLADAVSCPEELRPVVRFFLGDTVMVKTFEEARDAVGSGAARRAVSLDGVLVRAGGVVSVAGGARPGGREAPGGASLERMRLLREVRAELGSRRERLSALAAKRSETDRALAEARAERSRVASRHQGLALERATLSEQLASRGAREAAERERVETAAARLPELGHSILEAETGLLRLEETQRQLSGEEEKLRQEVGGLEVAARAQNESLEAAGRLAGELRVLVATLAEQERAGEAEAGRLTEEAGRLEAEADQYGRRLDRLALEKEEAAAELGPLQATLAEAADRPGAGSTEDLEAWRQRRDKVTGDLEARESELSGVRAALAESTGRERREETRLARLEVEEEMAVRRLRRDYGEDWEEKAGRLGPDRPDLSEEEAAARVGELRQALSGLGVVNIGAIEEHRRLLERVTFLKGQAQDLEEARESLLRLIAEMDETMAARFEEGFLVVRRAFRERVSQLFGGGKGDLILTDRDDLLGSGIDILVEPPAKRLQSLALLSSGERALAALALLLSFLESRPCPCVVLDEIDAPLDDTNVGRFATALTSLAGVRQTQFIVVTHNRATMEISEVLYGATMGEDGVSRLVSVKLEDAAALGDGLAEEAV